MVGFTLTEYTDLYEVVAANTYLVSTYVPNPAAAAATVTTGLQNALNAVKATGGTLTFPSNETYVINATLTMTDADDYAIVGNGSTIQMAAGVSNASPIMYWTRCKNAYLGFLTLDGNRANRTQANSNGHCFQMYELNSVQIGGGQAHPEVRITFEQMTVMNNPGNDGVMIRGTFPGSNGNANNPTPQPVPTNTESWNLLFYKCNMLRNHRNGMSFNNGHNVQILGGSYSFQTTVSGKDVDLPGAGIDIEPNSLVTPAGTPACHEVLIKGVTFEANDGRGVLLAGGKGGTHGITNVSIIGCYFADGASTPIALGGPSPIPTSANGVHVLGSNCLVAHNTFEGFTRTNGAGIIGISGNGQVQLGEQLKPSTNLVTDNSINSTTTGDPILRQFSNCTGTGNVVTLNRIFSPGSSALESNGSPSACAFSLNTPAVGGRTDPSPVPPWDVTFAEDGGGGGGGGPGGTGFSSGSGEITITAAGGTGTKTYAHGLSFTPEVIRFTSNNTAAGAANGSSLNFMTGWAKSATEQWVATNFDEDAADTTNSTSLIRSDACVCLLAQDGSAAEDARGVFVSVDDTNISLNITNAPAADMAVQFFAIAGDALEVDVGTVAVLTTDSGVVNYDVVDFPGKAGIFTTSTLNVVGTARVDVSSATGFATEGSQVGMTWTADDGRATSNTNETLVTTRVIFQHDATTPATIDCEIAFDSWRAAGFSLNIVDPPTTTRTLGYVVFGGASLLAFAGSGAQKTSTGTQAYTTTGVTPQVVLFSGTSATTAGTTHDGLQATVGALDSDGNNRCIAVSSTDNAAISETGNSTSATKCLRYIGGAAGATVSEAVFDSATLGSFTLDWTTADANARLFGFLALELPANQVTVQVEPTGLSRTRALGTVNVIVTDPPVVTLTPLGLTRTTAIGTPSIAIPGPQVEASGYTVLTDEQMSVQLIASTDGPIDPTVVRNSLMTLRDRFAGSASGVVDTTFTLLEDFEFDLNLNDNTCGTVDPYFARSAVLTLADRLSAITQPTATMDGTYRLLTAAEMLTYMKDDTCGYVDPYIMRSAVLCLRDWINEVPV